MKTKLTLLAITALLASCSLTPASSSSSSIPPKSSSEEVKTSSSAEGSSSQGTSSNETTSTEEKSEEPSSEISSEMPSSESSEEEVLSSAEETSSASDSSESEEPSLSDSSEESSESEEESSSFEEFSESFPTSEESNEPSSGPEAEPSSEPMPSSEEPSSEISSEEPSSSSKTSDAPASPVSEDFLDFFDPENHSEVHIKASDEALAFVSDYQSSKSSQYADVYIPADVTIRFKGKDYVFEEAGIRMKGNTSRTSFFYGGRISCPVHFKVSLKATFDEKEYDDWNLSSFKHDWSEDASGRKARKNRNFLGLEKFDVKYVPRNNNECIVREPYAYRCFQNAGLMAPYTTLVNFSLSGDSDTYYGTYEFVETIDKQFLKRRLSKAESSGDLYKCTYNGMGKADFSRTDAIDKSTGNRIAYGKIGVEDSWNNYHPIYDLKTNEDNGEDSDFSKMTNFIQVLWNNVYGSKDASSLESVLDVQEFLSFSAVSYLLGNFDDQRYNYNNFYLYFRPSDGKAMFIPYDWDWCLGLDLGLGMQSLTPLQEWTLDGGTSSNVYQAALYGDVLSYAKSDYLSYVAAYAPDVLDSSAFSSLASAYGQYSEIDSVSAYMNAKRNVLG
ncbi:MAG: CotH kinase family protein [Bacilli bacterium]|nr:CotH kinase family protein [Bacilli bacterium]